MRRCDEAGGAEATLQCVMLAEGGLQRRQVVARHPFDRHDLFAIGLNGEHQAGADRLSVQQHCTGTTDAVFAAEMRTGLAEIVTKAVCQAGPPLDAGTDSCAIEFEFDLHLRYLDVSRRTASARGPAVSRRARGESRR